MLNGTPQSGILLSGAGYVATEYWDVVPDTRYSYEYTVTAIPPQGCAASAAVKVNPPYALPNPPNWLGVHASDVSASITWIEILGATQYRVDGPGLSNYGWILPGEVFVPGQKPAPVGVLDSGSSVHQYLMTAAVPLRGVAGAMYRVTAMFPGNFADHAHGASVWVPRVSPVITGISPTSGTKGQTDVIISGKYFTDPGDGMTPVIVFGAAKTGAIALGMAQSTPKSVAPTQLIVTAGVSGYITVVTYAAAPGGGPNGAAVSPVAFTSITPTTPPPPPTQVRVPQVDFMSLKNARQVLSRAGLTTTLIYGPGSDTSIVNSEAPGFGALVNTGSKVELTTAVGGPYGLSKLTLRNDLAPSLAIWTLDPTTGQPSQQNGGNAVDPGDSATISFDATGLYLVYGVNPQTCNDPVNCWTWQAGYYGDPNGPTASDSMH